MCKMSPEPPQRSFQDALSAAQAGDQEAINDLFTWFYPRVRQIVHKSLATDLRDGRGWLSARFSTGDVVQEVFWSVLGNLKSFGGDTEGAFIGYLSMVVRNRIIDAVRYHQAGMRDGRLAAPEPHEGQHSSTAATPLDAALLSEDAERYQAALRELSERTQLLLRARFEDSATFEELAEQLGYSHEASARRAFYSAMAKLTVSLKRDQDMGDV